MVFHSLPPNQLIDAAHLPLTLISLEDWVLINITGIDSEKYLQSQVTADINQITERQHLLTAHCNHKGKIWSTLRLFRRQNCFIIIERRSLHENQLIELKKYAVFSKVKITVDKNHILLGIAGLKARDVLKGMFNILPNANIPLVNDDMTSILWFQHPAERFLLMTDIVTAERVIESLRDKAQLNNSQQWLVLNIEAGEPVIDLINVGKFIPQAINLQALGGISFSKGCYIGQEMVARAKFCGVNKRSLWYLVGHASRVPEAGENLELKIGKQWRRTGIVLAAAQLYDGRLIVQAVISNDIKANNVFRVCADTNILSIKPLPYSFSK